jgi:hypothetical protein
MELATLKGTEKQVNWAKAIRNERLKVWQGTDTDIFQKVELMLSHQSGAAWWIANKDKSLGEVSRQFQDLTWPKQIAEIPGKKAATVPLKLVTVIDDGELWETVKTANGFTRSGPTRDMVTGEVVVDASLPF